MDEPHAAARAHARQTFLHGTGHAADAPQGATRWLGRRWWANRLQDWVRVGDRFECVAARGHRRVRTVSALTTELVDAPAVIRVRTGSLATGNGFSGILIGTGAPGDDWRARVLVGAASGEGGGLLVTFEADGVVRFREHTDETAPFAVAEIPSLQTGSPSRRTLDEDVTLELVVSRDLQGGVRLFGRAYDTASGLERSTAQLSGVPIDQVRGGVALVSSTFGTSRARYWLAPMTVSGDGAARHPERALGPVVGTLFSVSSGVLKMTAQLMPVELATLGPVELQVRTPRGWVTLATEPVGPGYTVPFRVPRWDSGRAWRYRVLVDGVQRWSGTVPAEPDGRELVLASINCIKAAHRPTDRVSDGKPRLPGQVPLGLYTQRNIYFPHDQLAANIARHEPDLLVAHGDQLYEASPTAKDGDLEPEMDFLAKYVLWLWSFRELTRSIPTVVLVDDHDVYQGNLWGNGGVAAPGRRPISGGYVNTASWVNAVQRVQCGHNPDPYDPRPVAQGIEVYYGSFSYGGTSFAMLEDRKFKAAPGDTDVPPGRLALLGRRQESFLEAWAGQLPDLPKVVLTQTPFACVQTDVDGSPVRDKDSNGWPAPARDRALRLVRAAGALMLSGDQHLGSVVRHGIDAATDGPLQFTAPAGSTSFQRWFDPAGGSTSGAAGPATGDWVDGFGNRCRVLAVVQPSFTRAEHHAVYPGSDFGDRRLKNEGYGIIRIRPLERTYQLECWRWDSDPASQKQFPGFPRRGRFDLPG